MTGGPPADSGLRRVLEVILQALDDVTPRNLTAQLALAHHGEAPEVPLEKHLGHADDVDASIITGIIAAVLRGSAMMRSMKGIDLLPRGTSETVVDVIMKGLEPR